MVQFWECGHSYNHAFACLQRKFLWCICIIIKVHPFSDSILVCCCFSKITVDIDGMMSTFSFLVWSASLICLTVAENGSLCFPRLQCCECSNECHCKHDSFNGLLKCHPNGSLGIPVYSIYSKCITYIIIHQISLLLEVALTLISVLAWCYLVIFLATAN